MQFIDLYTCAIIVFFKSPYRAKTTSEIAGHLEISPCTINDIYTQAIKKGFDLNYKPFSLKPEYVKDATCTGCPKKQINENV